MTQTYAQLQQQITRLQREAEAVKRKEVDGVIARIREAVKAYGLTAADLGLGRGTKINGATKTKPARKGSKRKYTPTVKYRDEAGNTWVGRGPRPQWLRDALKAGKSLEDFAA